MFKSFLILTSAGVIIFASCMTSESQNLVESQSTEIKISEEIIEVDGFPWEYGQETAENGLEFVVKSICPDLSMTLENLKKAKDVHGLNPYFKEEWVKEYISIEISSSLLGMEVNLGNAGRELSEGQKLNLSMVDPGTEVTVKVRYLPNNSLIDNNDKVETFTFEVLPETNAEYHGSEVEMYKYLKENAINKISKDSFEQYGLAAITFTISPDGSVKNAKVLTSSSDKAVDKILLKAVKDFPNWQPASYSNGSKTSQDFVLAVGDMESCNANLLGVCDWRRTVE